MENRNFKYPITFLRKLTENDKCKPANIIGNFSIYLSVNQNDLVFIVLASELRGVCFDSNLGFGIFHYFMTS